MKKTILITTLALVLGGVLFIINRLAEALDSQSSTNEVIAHDTVSVVDLQYPEATTEDEKKRIVSELASDKDFIPRQEVKSFFLNQADHGMDGLFIQYDLANKEDPDYPLRGIRLYEKKGTEYRFAYDNPKAWMCEGCNNSLHAWFEFNSDTLKIMMLYGPHQSADASYDFLYNKTNKHWQLVACDERPVKETANIYLENYDIEETPYQAGIYKNMYSDLDNLYDILLKWDNNTELSRGYFISEDDHQLNISSENIDELIDEMTQDDYETALKCASILYENRNYQCEYLLEEVISKYPNHPLDLVARKQLKSYENRTEEE